MRHIFCSKDFSACTGCQTCHLSHSRSLNSLHFVWLNLCVLQQPTSYQDDVTTVANRRVVHDRRFAALHIWESICGMAALVPVPLSPTMRKCIAFRSCRTRAQRLRSLRGLSVKIHRRPGYLSEGRAKHYCCSPRNYSRPQSLPVQAARDNTYLLLLLITCFSFCPVVASQN